MTRDEAKAEINKVFEPAFANYIITALTEGATPSERKTGKWIVKQRGNATDMCCSNCGAIRIKDLSWGYPAEEIEKGLYNGNIEFIPYCERCGVKMEVDE